MENDADLEKLCVVFHGVLGQHSAESGNVNVSILHSYHLHYRVLDGSIDLSV